MHASNLILIDSRTLWKIVSYSHSVKGNKNFWERSSSLGCIRTVRTPDIEEAVFNLVGKHSETHTRILALTLNISYVQVWKILIDNLWYPYHIQRVQALLSHDFSLRINFCRALFKIKSYLPTSKFPTERYTQCSQQSFVVRHIQEQLTCGQESLELIW